MSLAACAAVPVREVMKPILIGPCCALATPGVVARRDNSTAPSRIDTVLPRMPYALLVASGRPRDDRLVGHPVRDRRRPAVNSECAPRIVGGTKPICGVLPLAALDCPVRYPNVTHPFAGVI